MSASRKVLHHHLDYINSKAKTAFELNLNTHYGGWQLTSNNGSHIVQHRITYKQMLAYLQGIKKGLELWNL
jgi:hypothetical protein